MSEDGLTPGKERFPEQAHLDAAARGAQKRRNIWLGLALLGFVLLVGMTTFVRLSGSQDNQANFYYNMNQTGQKQAPALPPGMSPEEAAPPANLSAEPVVVQEEVIIEEESPEE
jgi:flagellar basal body-associated protein FliL